MFSKVTTNLVVLPKFVTVTYKMDIVLFKVFNVKSMTGTHKITIIATFFFANGFLHSDYSRTESSEHCILRKCVQMGKTNQHGKTSQQKKNKKVGPVQKYGKQKNRRVVHIQKNTITKKKPLQKKPNKKQELQQQTTGHCSAKHACCCTAIREQRETVATFLCVCVRCRVQQRGMTASLLCDYTPTNLGEHQVRQEKKRCVLP